VLGYADNPLGLEVTAEKRGILAPGVGTDPELLFLECFMVNGGPGGSRGERRRKEREGERGERGEEGWTVLTQRKVVSVYESMW
jgi:hypothetical protein